MSVTQRTPLQPGAGTHVYPLLDGYGRLPLMPSPGDRRRRETSPDPAHSNYCPCSSCSQCSRGTAAAERSPRAWDALLPLPAILLRLSAYQGLRVSIPTPSLVQKRDRTGFKTDVALGLVSCQLSAIRSLLQLLKFCTISRDKFTDWISIQPNQTISPLSTKTFFRKGGHSSGLRVL